MRETGKIVSVSGGRAEVEVAARGECEHCSAHSVCNWTGTSVRRVQALDKIGVSAGELVELELDERIGARTNVLVFGIPALLMLAGVLVGGLVLHKDLWSGILTGIGLALGLGIVKLIDVAVSRSGRSLPVIVRLAEKSEACPERAAP
ncbi:SoxR reducing system RseC family protein [candidate division WOR-3 bacterium]|nr:SoxR reducing system RseC family protein [candidate division WOR-3 bacterium]